MKLQPLFAVLGVFAGCSFESGEPTAPVFDGDAPRVQIVSPARGTIAGDVTHVVVTGTVSDDSGSVESVMVNGVAAALAADGTWSANVPVAPGTSLLHAIAVDARKNRGEATRAVVAGPMVELGRQIASGIRATLSTHALDALARETATFIESGGLQATVQAMNPLANVGGGPDCFYGQATITSLALANADVRLEPTTGGIAVSTVLDEVDITMHVEWAVACQADSRDVVMSAQRVSVQGLLAIEAVDRTLDIQFDKPDVQVTGFELQLPDLPEDIAQMLDLDAAVSASLGLVTERIAVPIVSRTLDPLDDAQTIDVAGARVAIEVAPTRVSFSAEGATIDLDTSLRAHGDRGSFVYVPNIAPTFDMAQGFQLALADDAANQLLTSMWSAKAFDTTIDLAALSDEKVGDLYDAVRFQLAVPPHVEATGSPLQLTIGDWIATFERDGAVAATVAIHAQSSLYVVEREDGTLQLRASTPSVTVDVLDEVNLLTKLEYQAIRSFALERVEAVGSAAVAAIPLPVLGNAVPTTLWVDPRDGYLHIAGDVQ